MKEKTNKQTNMFMHKRWTVCWVDLRAIYYTVVVEEVKFTSYQKLQK